MRKRADVKADLKKLLAPWVKGAPLPPSPNGGLMTEAERLEFMAENVLFAVGIYGDAEPE